MLSRDFPANSCFLEMGKILNQQLATSLVISAHLLTINLAFEPAC